MSQVIGSIVRQIDVDIILISNGFAAAIIGMRLPLFETKITTLSLRALIDHNFVIMNKIHVSFDILVCQLNARIIGDKLLVKLFCSGEVTQIVLEFRPDNRFLFGLLLLYGTVHDLIAKLVFNKLRLLKRDL